MIFNNQLGHKRLGSGKKMHRRVVTEIEEKDHLLIPRNQVKRSEKLSSKPKFLDVYSKYVGKETNSQRRNFKIYQTKPLCINKNIKTEPDQISKASISLAQKSRVPSIPTKYEIQGVAGKGTFGVVYFGLNRSTGERVAIKKVLQDKKYKNREHQILKILKHPNNLVMKDSFLTYEGDAEYLNIVMEYFTDNLYQVIKKKEVNAVLLKIYAYQIFRGLNYLAMLSIAHRDIKPQNILVDRVKHKLIISDFGSAKQLVPTQTNLAYICSRCYRAPQLIFGACDYTVQIDMWSTGCVLVEMVNGVPPFMGDSQVDQLKEIITILGTPSEREVKQMNKNFDMGEYKRLPLIKRTVWNNVMKTKDELLIDLVTKVLKYSPVERITPAEALMHAYFDQLRDETRYQQILFKIKAVPELFDFTEQQLGFIFQTTNRKCDLVPEWAVKKPSTLHLNTNKITNSSTNTKRSILSFKAF